MSITASATHSLFFLLVIFSGCGKPPTVDKSAPDAAADAASPGDAAQEKARTEALTASPEQKCLAENYKIEAARRWKETALEPFFIEAGIHARLMALLNAVKEAAAARKYDALEQPVTKTWQEIKPLQTGISESDLMLMQNVVEVRTAAYATCRAIASRDISWCTSLESLPNDIKYGCIGEYVFYVVIAEEAIGKGKSCQEAAGDLQAYRIDNVLAICNAVKEQKPDLCPADDTTQAGIYCRAAASRATTHVCKNISSGKLERDIGCCELFSWRFANVASGHADPYVIPEAGALSGDEKGCMRALMWGIMEDLGPIFGFDVPKDTAGPAGKDSYGNYLCPSILQWSQREPPM